MTGHVRGAINQICQKQPKLIARKQTLILLLESKLNL